MEDKRNDDLYNDNNEEEKLRRAIEIVKNGPSGIPGLNVPPPIDPPEEEVELDESEIPWELLNAEDAYPDEDYSESYKTLADNNDNENDNNEDKSNDNGNKADNGEEISLDKENNYDDINIDPIGNLK